MKKLKIKNSLVRNRESIKTEFKSTFHLSQKEYIRTICAFANSQGGKIIFGIKDKPREALGLNKKKYKIFNEYDTKDLTNQIQNNLSENILFKFSEFEQRINGKKLVFGILSIEESKNKPIICTTTDSGKKLREGAVYYRYSGKSEEIKSQDFIRLIQDEREKEKKIFLQHLEKITSKGPSNVGVFSYDGEMFVDDKKIIIDKEAVKQIKFIKEGQFVEKEGFPALVLKGEIKNMDSLEIVHEISDPNITHPFEGTSSVKKEVLKNKQISFVDRETFNGIIKDAIYIKYLSKKYSLQYLLQKINGHLALEDNMNYCWHNKKRTIKKYNRAFVNKCVKILRSEKELKKVLK